MHSTSPTAQTAGPGAFLDQLAILEERHLSPLDRGQYRLARFLFLRGLGFVYLVAFFSLSRQLAPLIGAEGLLPASLYLHKALAYFGAPATAFLRVPTLFWLGASDAILHLGSWLGVVLSLLLLGGLASAPLLLALWALYMSFFQIGQIFYGYGWEMLLLETGFLAIFLCPLWRGPAALPTAHIWLLRWVLFRVVLGAGLIKLRGDECWRDLSCLLYHYETQPLPNPLSWYLHQLPPLLHRAGALFTHFVELVVPWFLFAPRRLRHLAGLLQIAFQLLLILSGNLSWLNYLTLILCIACFDDRALGRLFPTALAARLQTPAPSHRARRAATWMLCLFVFYLSIPPVLNMASSDQAMNRSFDSLHLVNTYGAFGSVGRERYEIVVMGTHDDPEDPQARWLEYEFPAKPGDIRRRPALVSPYHYRLDWQMWFAAMSDYRRHPWFAHLLYKLLQGDPGALGLLAENPFPQAPPTHIRADLYRYRFTTFAEDPDAWWQRQRVGTYLGPFSARDPALLKFIEHYGWKTR